jgi:LysR family carnitine catabolism transcriptional activator
MQELGAYCVPLEGPRIERRIGLVRLAEHRLSAAAEALQEVLVAGAYG